MHLLRLLHLDTLSKDLFTLLHQIHLHVHCLFEALISKVKDLLKSSLVHGNHLLLIIK
jgi:hypothetical protein